MLALKVWTDPQTRMPTEATAWVFSIPPRVRISCWLEGEPWPRDTAPIILRAVRLKIGSDFGCDFLGALRVLSSCVSSSIRRARGRVEERHRHQLLEQVRGFPITPFTPAHSQQFPRFNGWGVLSMIPSWIISLHDEFSVRTRDFTLKCVHLPPSPSRASNFKSPSPSNQQATSGAFPLPSDFPADNANTCILGSGFSTKGKP